MPRTRRSAECPPSPPPPPPRTRTRTGVGLADMREGIPVGEVVHAACGAEWCITSAVPLGPELLRAEVLDVMLPGRLGCYVYPADAVLHVPAHQDTKRTHVDHIFRNETNGLVGDVQDVIHHMSVHGSGGGGGAAGGATGEAADSDGCAHGRDIEKCGHPEGDEGLDDEDDKDDDLDDDPEGDEDHEDLCDHEDEGDCEDDDCDGAATARRSTEKMTGGDGDGTDDSDEDQAAGAASSSWHMATKPVTRAARTRRR